MLTESGSHSNIDPYRGSVPRPAVPRATHDLHFSTGPRARVRHPPLAGSHRRVVDALGGGTSPNTEYKLKSALPFWISCRRIAVWEDSTVSNDLDAVHMLTPWLRPGEALVWAGRPDPSVWVTSSDRYLIVFGLVWCAVVVRVEVAAVSKGDTFTALFTLVFVLLGLYITVGRFAIKAMHKKRTAYGITKDRAIVVNGTSMMDAPLGSVATSVRRHRGDRHVTVAFGPRRESKYANTGMEFIAPGQGGMTFFDVPDVDGLLAALGNI